MLAVAGGKGGCGKTTTTLGLAAALVRQRKSAVAADADREMPNLHAMAGVTRNPGLDAVAAGWPARMVAGTADAPALGVEILPAASGLVGVESTDSRRNSTSTASMASTSMKSVSIESVLTRIRGCGASVLLDCPAGAGPDAVTPLRVADAAVVVTTAEPACLRDAAKTAAMARELGTPVAGATVTRTAAPPEGVARLLDCPVLGVVPDAMDADGDQSEGDETIADPLADDRVRGAYDALLSALQPKYL